MRFTNRLCLWAWQNHAVDIHLNSALCSNLSLNKLSLLDCTFKHYYNVNQRTSTSLKNQKKENGPFSDLLSYWKNLNLPTITQTNPSDQYHNSLNHQKNNNDSYLHNALVIYNHKNIESLLMKIEMNEKIDVTYSSTNKESIENGSGNKLDNINNSDLNESKRTNKNIQPADEPNQKIRVLSEKLRNELPLALNKCNPWHDFTIYTKQIELYYTAKNSKTYSISGLPWYKRVLSSFRWGYMFYLNEPSFDLLSLLTDEEQRVINIRWRISGFNPFCLISIYIFKMPVNKRYYDFMSTFYITKNGKVWRHDIKKIREISDTVPLGAKLKALKNRGLATGTAIANKTTIFKS